MSVQPLIPNRNFTDLEVATDAVTLARQVVGTLIRAGVKEVVVCPGSRNAPLLYAVAAAEAAGRIRTHIKLDERAAGFFALGLSRSTQISKLRAFTGVGGEEKPTVEPATQVSQSGDLLGEEIEPGVRAANGMQPVAIMVTSGTAAGELHAAILEAHHVGAPLIVITADRPKYMVGTGANQTTNQEAIYGWAVQGCVQVEAVGVKPDPSLKGGEEDGLDSGTYLWGDASGANGSGQKKIVSLTDSTEAEPDWDADISLDSDCGCGCSAVVSPIARPNLRSRFHKQVGKAVARCKHPSATQPTIPVIPSRGGLCPKQELTEAITVALTVGIGGNETWAPNSGKSFLEYEKWHANRVCVSGPVHLNLRWAPPLTPEPSWEWPVTEIPVFDPKNPLICPACRQTGQQCASRGRENKCAMKSGGVFVTRSDGSRSGGEEYRDPYLPPLTVTDRTVAIAGDQAQADVLLLLTRAGIPIISEPTGSIPAGGGAIPHASLLLNHFSEQIDQVIVTGHPTLSRPITGLLSRTELPIYVVNNGLPRFDLSGTSHQIGICTLERMLEEIPVEVAQRLRVWSSRWWGKAGQVEEKFRRYCQQQIAQLDPLGIIDPYVFARTLTQHHSHSGAPAVFLGASNTIRAFDRAIEYLPPFPAGDQPQPGRCNPLFFANRGLAGIDGSTSTALGMAIGSGKSMRLVCGDLTFLHDLTGLLRGHLEPESLPPNTRTGTGLPGRPSANLDLFVLNDQGGQIFSSLEHGRPQYAAVFDRYFRTPQICEVAAIAQGLGWEYRAINNLSQLQRAFQRQPLGLRIYEINTNVPNYRQVRERFFNEL